MSTKYKVELIVLDYSDEFKDDLDVLKWYLGDCIRTDAQTLSIKVMKIAKTYEMEEHNGSNNAG